MRPKRPCQHPHRNKPAKIFAGALYQLTEVTVELKTFFWIFGDGNWWHAEAWIVLLAGAVEVNALCPRSATAIHSVTVESKSQPSNWEADTFNHCAIADGVIDWLPQNKILGCANAHMLPLITNSNATNIRKPCALIKKRYRSRSKVLFTVYQHKRYYSIKAKHSPLNSWLCTTLLPCGYAEPRKWLNQVFHLTLKQGFPIFLWPCTPSAGELVPLKFLMI